MTIGAAFKRLEDVAGRIKDPELDDAIAAMERALKRPTPTPAVAQDDSGLPRAEDWRKPLERGM